jgi:hypothetical protein
MSKYLIGLMFFSISLSSRAEIKQCTGKWECKLTCSYSVDSGSPYSMCNTYGNGKPGATVGVMSTARIDSNSGSIFSEDVDQILALCLAKDSFFAAAWKKYSSLPSGPIGSYIGYVGGSGVCN